jgi:hypothetical protein
MVRHEFVEVKGLRGTISVVSHGLKLCLTPFLSFIFRSTPFLDADSGRRDFSNRGSV